MGSPRIYLWGVARKGFAMRARNLRLFLGGSMLATVLAGCGQNAGNPGPSETPTEAAAMPSDAAETSDSSYVVDEGSAPAATQVVAVPAPVAAADPAEAAPLDDAETIVRAIGEGHGIERIRHGDGWAWMQDGRIIRTASADGKRVAYFRNGSDNPFLVQDGDRAYAYSGNTVTHAYDRGRPQKIDTGDRDKANKWAGKARDDRNDARHVADTHPHPVQHPTPPPTPTPTPRPTPTHEPSHGQSGHSSGDGHQGRTDNDGRGPTGPSHGTPAPAPTPSPSPSHTHRPDHGRDSD